MQSVSQDGWMTLEVAGFPTKLVFESGWIVVQLAYPATLRCTLQSQGVSSGSSSSICSSSGSSGGGSS